MITNTNEDIPEITYPTWKENDLRNRLAEKAQARRLMKLFIRDLLDAEKTVCTKNKKTFSMNGVTFSRILLQGTVISVDVRGAALEPKTWVRIQDGTGCLDCIARRRPELDELQTQTERQQEEAVHEFAASGAVLKASLMMLQSAKNNLVQVVRHGDFKLGDEVRLIGELSEYRGKRYCFVVTAVKVAKDEIDCDFISSYIEDVFELYSKFYVTKKL